MFEFHPRSKSQAESNVMPHGDRQVKLLKWVQTLFIYCHLHHTHTPQKLTHTSATFHRLQFAVDTRCSSHGWRNAKLKKKKRGTKQKETALKKKSRPPACARCSPPSQSKQLIYIHLAPGSTAAFNSHFDGLPSGGGGGGSGRASRCVGGGLLYQKGGGKETSLALWIQSVNISPLRSRRRLIKLREASCSPQFHL